MYERRSRFLVFLLLLHVPSATVRGQDAGPFVPAGHWSAAAVDHLHAAGVAPPGTVRGQGSRSVGEVRAILEHAVERGSVLAGAWQRRFEQEFGGAGVPTVHAAGELGAGTLDGVVAPGVYTTWGEDNWTGVRARPDRTTAVWRGAVLAALGDRLSAGAAASRDPARTRIDELYVSARAGVVGMWAGRRLHRFGPGTSGIVLNGAPPVDGGGVFLTEPVRLPWLLRHLGPVRMEVAAGVLDENGPVRRPVFVMTRGSFEPHSRVGLGVTRGGMIGPDAGARGIDDILFFLIGGQTGGSEYDNQVVAVEAWLRPPLGRVPVLLYVEWGAEDTSGAWWDVPGILAGIELADVPGLEGIAVGIERVVFERSGSGNPPWYRHPIGFHEGWTSRSELIGHPLGGHGREWLAHARATLFDANLIMSARAFARVRGVENLFAPERAGSSHGVAADIDMEVRPGIGIRVGGLVEDGADWRTSQLHGALRLYFQRAQ